MHSLVVLMYGINLTAPSLEFQHVNYIFFYSFRYVLTPLQFQLSRIGTAYFSVGYTCCLLRLYNCSIKFKLQLKHKYCIYLQ
jgi:uncharacterized membrane protein YciS (DUF1049 family)